MPKLRTIAIDGPAAVGKSTVGYRLAKRLGFLFVDTGALFRAIAWKALREGINLKNHKAVMELARKLDIRLASPKEISSSRRNTVYVNGKDITEELYQPDIDASVALVGANPLVRPVLIKIMRDIAASGRVVMIGRDIGTRVLPDADLKIWLEASVEERARRRFRELKQEGQNVAFEKVLQDMMLRDRLDVERSVSPMVPAEDAIIIHTDHLTIEEVVNKIMQYIAEKEQGR